MDILAIWQRLFSATLSGHLCRLLFEAFIVVVPLDSLRPAIQHDVSA